MVDVVGAGAAAHGHAGARQELVRRPPDVVAGVLVDKADDPQDGEEVERERMDPQQVGGQRLAGDDDGVLDGVDPAAGPRERGAVLVVDGVDVAAQPRVGVHVAVLPVDQKVADDQAGHEVPQALQERRRGRRQGLGEAHGLRVPGPSEPRQAARQRVGEELGPGRRPHLLGRRPVIGLDLGGGALRQVEVAEVGADDEVGEEADRPRRPDVGQVPPAHVQHQVPEGLQHAVVAHNNAAAAANASGGTHGPGLEPAHPACPGWDRHLGHPGEAERHEQGRQLDWAVHLRPVHHATAMRLVRLLHGLHGLLRRRHLCSSFPDRFRRCYVFLLAPL